jgi:type I restriction enzyme, S subunit
MGSDFWTTIGEIAEIFDGPHATPKKIDDGPFFLSISSLREGKLDLSQSAHLSEDEFVKWTRRVTPEAGDVLFSYETRLGEAALMPPNVKACLGRRMGLLRPKKDKVSSRYLLYAYLSPAFQSEIKLRTINGCTVDRIPLKELPSFPIRIPLLPEQKAIAHVLGSLDDRIELNRRINETLESMAQALFKSWFVDFDPVIDNALTAGKEIPAKLSQKAQARAALGDKRRPLPEEIRTLFPDEFTYSDELGWIPRGWSSRAIGESFQLLGGHPFKSVEYVDDGHFGVVTIKNVQNGNFVQECANRVTELPVKMKDHCRLAVGDVLLSLTGNVGRVCMVSEGHYLLNQRVSKIVGVDAIPRSFAYFFFRHNALYEMMLIIAKGTAQQNLSPIETSKLKQMLPSNEIMVELSGSFDSIFRKIIANTVQSQALTRLRDTLLPKLLSGEVRIPDAEKMVEELAL